MLQTAWMEIAKTLQHVANMSCLATPADMKVITEFVIIYHYITICIDD